MKSAIGKKPAPPALSSVDGMITNVSLTTIYCLDQDQAKDFWVGTLGFEVHTDATVSDDFRWLTVAHPDHPELEVTLMKPGPPLAPEASEMIRQQLEKGQMGGLGLAVDDCRRTAAELAAKGVVFVQEPADRPYGVEAVMRDNSGNWLVLVEQRPYDAGSADFPH